MNKSGETFLQQGLLASHSQGFILTKVLGILHGYKASCFLISFIFLQILFHLFCRIDATGLTLVTLMWKRQIILAPLIGKRESEFDGVGRVNIFVVERLRNCVKASFQISITSATTAPFPSRKSAQNHRGIMYLLLSITSSRFTLSTRLFPVFESHSRPVARRSY